MIEVCPQCHVRGPARLTAGQVCAACDAQNAWSRAGDRLVIGAGDIAEAVDRRAGEAAGEPAWRRALVWLPPALSLTLGAIAALLLVPAFAERRIGPIGPLIEDLLATSRHAMLAGIAATVAAAFALLRLRRQRHYRRLPLVASHLLGLIAGLGAALGAGVQWSSLGDPDLAHLKMPARDASGVRTPGEERIMQATAVILSPDEDGDARGLAIGTGAVIARDAKRAWIVTCSHVAMPYAAVAAWRDPADAQTVWVQLADGREGDARVRWTADPPLDVALLELRVENAPEPVALSPDSDGLTVSSPVLFVPNPFRAGWLVHRGAVLRRESHVTTAGTFSLLFTDLPVQPGDSGSGLYDGRGRLVGLNTWTSTGPGGPHGISLPSEAIRGLMESLPGERE